MRKNNRQNNEIRKINIIKNFLKHPAGSVLIEVGDTKVICACTITDGVPFFLKGTGQGWLNAEYSLIPSATNSRAPREAIKGKQSGRTQEIQRLIGRSLRSVMDLKALGEKTVHIDCDVIQADGGTRTAAITGSFIALTLALDSIYDANKIFPLKKFLGAVSVGINENNEVILDLCYEEDSNAIADMNVIMTDEGEIIEIQGTGEAHPFTRKQLDEMLLLAEIGIDKITSYIKDILGNKLVWKIGREP